MHRPTVQDIVGASGFLGNSPKFLKNNNNEAITPAAFEALPPVEINVCIFLSLFNDGFYPVSLRSIQFPVYFIRFPVYFIDFPVYFSAFLFSLSVFLSFVLVSSSDFTVFYETISG